MNTKTESSKPSMLARAGSSLMLGLLITALSVLTAVANYATYQVSGTGSGYSSDAERLLSDSDTEYLLATQYIIVDYTMFDGYYVNQDSNATAAEYYLANFSDELLASIDRDDPFDDQYYEEMYAQSDALTDQAYELFDKASLEGERETGFQIAMLIAAVGLAFAAYASLLDEKNKLRGVFAILSLAMLLLSLGQIALVALA